jgi:hypothetical protein
MFKQMAGGLDIVHIPYKSVVDLHWRSYAPMGIGIIP